MVKEGVYEGLAYVHLESRRNRYIVDGFAKHSETYEWLVLYSRLDVACGGGTVHTQWACPIDLFKEKFMEECAYSDMKTIERDEGGCK